MEQRDNLKRYVLLEEYGVFKNSPQIAKTIYDKIMENKDKSNFVFRINNNFINRIKLVLNNDNGAGFSPTESIIKGKKYDMLYIEINNDDAFNKKECIPLLMHELTHAYQSLKYCLTNKVQLIDKINNDKYFDSIYGEDNGVYYLSNLKNIFYYTYGFEKMHIWHN